MSICFHGNSICSSCRNNRICSINFGKNDCSRYLEALICENLDVYLASYELYKALKIPFPYGWRPH